MIKVWKMNMLKKTVLFIMIGILVMQAKLYAIADEEISKIKAAMPASVAVEVQKDRMILVFDLCVGYKHSSIPYWDMALDVMAEKTGAFSVEHSVDMNVFAADSLAKYDAICFNNTTDLVPNQAQQKAIMDFIAGGKGIIGIHAATDSFKNWPAGMEMMGGVFTGHPWTSGGTWAVKIDEPGHPLVKPFGGKDFKVNDEIYRTEGPLYSRDKQRVLLSLDLSDEATGKADGVRVDDADTGISWIKSVGKGRVFYCSLGHNHHLTWDGAVLEHYLLGIQYALGDLKVDDEPAGYPMDAGKLDALIDGVKKYDWGKSEKSIYGLNEFIKDNMISVKNLAVIEGKLAGVLKSDAPLAAKEYVCQKLGIIGTEKSVGTLLDMMDEAATADMARCALERIDSDKVEAGLLEKIGAVTDATTKKGIIGTLGNRKCLAALDALSELSLDEDKGVSEAAINSLGQIATGASAVALDSRTGENQNACYDAMLRIAEINLRYGLSENKNSRIAKGMAKSIYEKLFSANYPAEVRAAALIGLLKCGEDASIISNALNCDEPVIIEKAAGSIAGVNDATVLENLASEMKSKPGWVQVQMITALGVNKNKVGTEQIEGLVSASDDVSVRMAGYEALAAMGKVSSIDVLAMAAVKAQSREERSAAQQALYVLGEMDVDKAIIEKIAAAGDGQEKFTCELIGATVERPMPSACDVLLNAARSSNRRVSLAAIKALEQLATGDKMDDVVKLMIEVQGDDTVKAVFAAAERNSKQSETTKLLMANYSDKASDETRVAILEALGMISNKACVGLLEKEFESDIEDVQDAAFKGMTNWRGDDFVDEMKSLAQTSDSMKRKVLAMRAYVRMVESQYGESDRDKAVSMLIEAFGFCPRVEEKKVVIGSLGNYGDEKVLEFLRGCLGDGEIRAEVEVSIVKVCEKLAGKQSGNVRKTLQELIDTTNNEMILEQAKKLFKND